MPLLLMLSLSQHWAQCHCYSLRLQLSPSQHRTQCSATQSSSATIDHRSSVSLSIVLSTTVPTQARPSKLPFRLFVSHQQVIIGLIVDVDVLFHVFLLIISYRHVRIQLAENLRLPCEDMALSTLDPVVMIQDNPPLRNEICSIRLPIDMSLGPWGHYQSAHLVGNGRPWPREASLLHRIEHDGILRGRVQI